MPRGAPRRSLEFVSPQLATLVDAAPSGDEWLYEVKYDGYRIECLVEQGTARLMTRRGLDWTAKYSSIAQAITKIAATDAIIDGELVVLDAQGRSSFQLLQQSDGAALNYFAFDLLQVNGEDLREQPLVARRARLEEILRPFRRVKHPVIHLSEALSGPGDKLLEAACRVGLEGIIGKQRNAPYRSTRAPSWVKVKCGKRQEFIVVGWTPPQGSRVAIGSLLLAVHDNGALRYAGRVGTGIPTRDLPVLLRQLRAIARDDPPFDRKPAGIPGGAQWVEPRMVVEVAFTEWTSDGLLRHPSFQGVRMDKAARDVKREKPVKARGSKPEARGSSLPSRGSTLPAGITITHPDRIVFPDEKITKLELAEHFARVAELMLPYVRERPLTLVRCPQGAGKQCFYQKHWTGDRPPAIGAVPILQSDGEQLHSYIRDVKGLVTLIQWGVMEIHQWGSRADDPERPDRMIFDLDPGPGVTWDDVRDGARAVHALLDELGLQSWLKTSGGKGLHVVVPLSRRSTWEDVSSFTRAIAVHMENAFPDRFIAVMAKAKRKGVIFVDWLRNTRGATAVAAWSTRARPGAGVSVPIPWTALARLKGGDQFTLQSLEKDGLPSRDPWEDMLKVKQGLTKEMIKRVK